MLDYIFLLSGITPVRGSLPLTRCHHLASVVYSFVYFSLIIILITKLVVVFRFYRSLLLLGQLQHFAVKL